MSDPFATVDLLPPPKIGVAREVRTPLEGELLSNGVSSRVRVEVEDIQGSRIEASIRRGSIEVLIGLETGGGLTFSPRGIDLSADEAEHLGRILIGLAGDLRAAPSPDPLSSLPGDFRRAYREQDS